MARYRVNLRTWLSRRRKVADWLDPGKGPWWLRPITQLRNRRILRAFIPRTYAPPRVRYRHRFPAWLVQQGAYWVSNVPRQRSWLRSRRWYNWRGNARLPRLHRFPSWLIQQGAYWLSNALVRRRVANQRKRIWRGNVRKPVLHRFPSWLFQQGAYWISNVLPRLKVTRVRKRSWRGNARNPRLHRRVWDLSGDQGPYWVSNVLARLKAIRPRRRVWTGNQRKPRFHRRVWDLSGDQGAYWVSNIPRQRAGLRRSRWYIWAGNARRPRLHRFPSWVFQQGAYWLRRKAKHFVPQPFLRRKRRFNAAWNVVVAAVSYFPKLRRRRPTRLSFLRRRTQQHRFPSWLVQQGPYWITNVPQRRKKLRTQPPAWALGPPKRYHRRFRVVFVYQFLLLVQQAWNWNAQAAKFTLNLGTVAKAWVWNGQAAVIGLTLGTVSKAWAWVANAPLVSFSLGMVSKAWNWIARPPVINLPVAAAGVFNIARGVVWGVVRGIFTRPRIGP